MFTAVYAAKYFRFHRLLNMKQKSEGDCPYSFKVGGALCPCCPPLRPYLCCSECCDVALRPVTPPELECEDTAGEKCRDKSRPVKVASLPTSQCTDVRRLHRPVPPERTITFANTDLLMKLFDVVDSSHKMNPSLAGQLRRGRSVNC